MGKSSYEVEAMALLKEHGELKRKARHGDLWNVNGKVVQIRNEHGLSSDFRSWKNALAEIKRALRGPSQEGRIEMEAVPPASRAPRLSDLGVHVQRSKKVIEEVRSEVTLPLEAVARALGLVANDTVAEYTLADVDGNPVLGPVLLVVKNITERSE
jgi:hypothetical protein